jgi:hypothetical protein
MPSSCVRCIVSVGCCDGDGGIVGGGGGAKRPLDVDKCDGKLMGRNLFKKFR